MAIALAAGDNSLPIKNTIAPLLVTDLQLAKELRKQVPDKKEHLQALLDEELLDKTDQTGNNGPKALRNKRCRNF
jgi:hypothetical protein